MPTVQENLNELDLGDPKGVVVELSLVGANKEIVTGYAVSGTLLSPLRFKPANDGTWSKVLEPNTGDLAGTRYRRVVVRDGVVLSDQCIEVTATPDPQQFRDILDDPPGTPESSALTGHKVNASAHADLFGAAALESIGAQVDQTLARTERDRWLALARNGGSATPPGPSHPSIHWIGGDVTDSLLLSGGSRFSIMADYLANPGSNDVVDANDQYTINILSGLQRNGAIVEEPPGGTFSFQVYQTGSSGIWLAAVAQGGLPADRIWWPMTLAQDAAVNGGDVVVGALLVDADAQTAAGFQLLDSHLILLHLFLGYSSHVATGLDPRLFQVNAIRKDATHFYILGQELDPPVDPAVGEPSYLAGDLATLRTHRSYTRIARVPLAQLTTVASWQFWSGTAWVAGLANAARLVDVDGTPVNGPGCIHLTPDGRWIFAAMALGDTHLDVYDADAPQGPWRRHARVPVPTAGKPAEGGIEVGWHTKIVGHLAAPAEHSIVSLTMAVLNLAGTGQGINIRRTCPQHVAIPWY